MATVTDPNGITLTYEYDDNNNVTSISDSQGGVTTMAYNGNNQVTSKTFQDGTTQLRVDFTYDLAGNVLTATRYNDVAGTELAGRRVYTYSGNRVTSIISTDASGVVLSSYAYSYNAGGELVSQVANGVTMAYSYDATGQLVQAGGTTYGYDPNGNTTGPGYVIGSDNRLLSDGTWNYTYDAVGNMIGKVGISNGLTWTYGYNNANRMISAVETETATGAVVQSAAYEYDVFGNVLIQWVTAGGTTTVSRFAYLPDGTLYGDVVGGTLENRYVSGVGGPDTWLARVATSGASAGTWLLSDARGSVTTVVSLTGGAIQDAITFDAFGNVTAETVPGAGGELGFQGGRYDPGTGNWMFGVREDDPGRRDWTTEDPMGFAAGDSNLQRFVGNGPTNATDPSGNQLIVAGNGALSDVLWQIQHTFNWNSPQTQPNVRKRPGTIKGRSAYVVLPNPAILRNGQAPADGDRKEAWPVAFEGASKWADDHGGDLYPSHIFWSIGSPDKNALVFRPDDTTHGVVVEPGTAGLSDQQRDALKDPDLLPFVAWNPETLGVIPPSQQEQAMLMGRDEFAVAAAGAELGRQVDAHNQAAKAERAREADRNELRGTPTYQLALAWNGGSVGGANPAADARALEAAACGRWMAQTLVTGVESGTSEALIGLELVGYGAGATLGTIGAFAPTPFAPIAAAEAAWSADQLVAMLRSEPGKPRVRSMAAQNISGWSRVIDPGASIAEHELRGDVGNAMVGLGLSGFNGGAALGVPARLAAAERAAAEAAALNAERIGPRLMTRDVPTSGFGDIISLNGGTAPRVARVAGDAPRVQWKLNPNGLVRTEEEILDVLRRGGIQVPDDVVIFVGDAKTFSGTLSDLRAGKSVLTAKLPPLTEDASGFVYFNQMYNKHGKIPVQINPSMLASDEAILAVMKHELYELGRFREAFRLGKGRMTFDAFRGEAMPGNAGNYHWMAWDEADEFIWWWRGMK